MFLSAGILVVTVIMVWGIHVNVHLKIQSHEISFISDANIVNGLFQMLIEIRKYDCCAREKRLDSETVKVNIKPFNTGKRMGA